MADWITTADLGTQLSTAEGAALAVAAACDQIRTLTGQTIDQVSSETIALDGTGTDALPLPQVPVTGVSSVSENDEVLVATDDYKLNGNGILLRMPTAWDSGWSTSFCQRTWRPGRQNIAVTYSHGYSVIPDDLKMLAVTLARRLLEQGSGVVFESLGSWSARYDGPAMSLGTGEMAIITRYRRL